MPVMWLSFVKDDKFAGVVITEAADVAEAIRKCWQNGVNPGGEIMSFVLPETATKELAYPRDTLLTQEFLQADGHKKIKDSPPEIQNALGFES